MSARLPASLHVLERGWLSANNILCVDGDQATLVDSGYVTHAEQTVELVRHALDGKSLTRLVNTHSHSDHIGGNAALKAAFGCRIDGPIGPQATIAEFDEDPRLISPHGQQSVRFLFSGFLQIDLQADGFGDDARFAERRPAAAQAVAGIGVGHADADADIEVFLLVFHGL